MAELKLTGGVRVWWDRRAETLLGEAAATFARLGRTEREAQAKFWIGKIHLGRDKFRKTVMPPSPPPRDSAMRQSSSKANRWRSKA